MKTYLQQSGLTLFLAGITSLWAVTDSHGTILVERHFLNVGLELHNLSDHVDVRNLDFGDVTINHTAVSVTILPSGPDDRAFNGDYFISLGNEHGGYAVLANRVGRTANSGMESLGYSDNGFHVTFDDFAKHDIHNYRDYIPGPLAGPVTGTWQPSGRTALPETVLATTERSAMLSSFNQTPASGNWWLMVSDTTQGGSGVLDSWSIKLELTPNEQGTLRLSDGDTLQTSDSGIVLSNAFEIEGSVRTAGSGNINLTGQLSGSGTLVHEGTGTLMLSEDSHQFLGQVEVRNGTLNISNPTGSATGSGAVLIDSGANLTGSGRIDGFATFASGSFLSPGDSPGTTIFGSNVQWDGAFTYIWEINDALGARGMDSGWDWADIAGSLDVVATAENPAMIVVTSLTLMNDPGNAANFDPFQEYTWTIASAAGGLIDFDPNAFDIDASNFSNPRNGGTFALFQSGDDINLNYSPIPEPRVYALGAGLFILAVTMIGRRRARNTQR